MRRDAKVDANQPAIVAALRKAGAHVTITSQLKNAFDIVVVAKGVVYIVEIKDFNAANRELTDGEKECKASVEAAGGTYNVIQTVTQALKMIGEYYPYCRCDVPNYIKGNRFCQSCNTEISPHQYGIINCPDCEILPGLCYFHEK